jgi:hypothetical protein
MKEIPFNINIHLKPKRKEVQDENSDAPEGR